MVEKHWKLIGLVVIISLMACPVTFADKDKGSVASRVEQLEKQMWNAAKKLDFERAASLRNKLKELNGNKKDNDNPGDEDNQHKKKYKGKVEKKDKGNGEVERKVTKAEVPAAALATLKKLARGAKITEFAEEIEFGHTFYEGSWKAPSGAKMDVLVTKTGDLVEIEEQVGTDKVPAAVLKAARKAAGKGAQLAFEKKTMILYEVKFQKGDSRHELLLTPDGRRVEEEVEKGNPDDGDDDEDNDKDKKKAKRKHDDDDNDKHKMKTKGKDNNEDGDDEGDDDEDDDDKDKKKGKGKDDDDDNDKHKIKAKCEDDNDEDDEGDDDEDDEDENGDDDDDDDDEDD